MLESGDGLSKLERLVFLRSCFGTTQSACQRFNSLNHARKAESASSPTAARNDSTSRMSSSLYAGLRTYHLHEHRLRVREKHADLYSSHLSISSLTLSRSYSTARKSTSTRSSPSLASAAPTRAALSSTCERRVIWRMWAARTAIGIWEEVMGDCERWGSRASKTGSRSGRGDGGRCFGRGRRSKGSTAEASEIKAGSTMLAKIYKRTDLC